MERKVGKWNEFENWLKAKKKSTKEPQRQRSDKL
jgi:hypothetical protein